MIQNEKLDNYHKSLFKVMTDLLEDSIKKDTVESLEDGLREVKEKYASLDEKSNEVTTKMRNAEYELMCKYLENNQIEKANNLCGQFDETMEEYVVNRVKSLENNPIDTNNYYGALLKVEISEHRNIDINSIKFWEGVLNIEKPSLDYRLPYEWQPTDQALMVKPNHFMGLSVSTFNCFGFFKYFKIHYDPRSEMNHMNMEDVQKLREYLIRPKIVKEIRIIFEEGIENVWLDLENVNSFCELYIKLPSTAQSFGGNLFKGNVNISYLDLSKTQIEIINKEALKDSTIKRFKAPMHLKKIGNHAFANCTSLQELDFSKTSLTYISRNAFYNSGIRKVKLSRDVRNVDIEAFGECKFLRTVDLSKTKIKRLTSGFLANSGVRKIKFPKGLEELEFGVFNECKSLEEIDLKNTEIKNVGPYAFFNSNIRRIRLPKSLEKIEYEAFAECTELKRLDLSNTNVKKIAAYAFYNSGIKGVKFPNDHVDINERAFTDCRALK